MKRISIFAGLTVILFCLFPMKTYAYSDEELCEMASDYYFSIYQQYPPIVEVDHVEGNMVTLHLYEVVTDVLDTGEEVGHTATWDWYEIDRDSGIGTDFMGEPVDLSSFAVESGEHAEEGLDGSLFEKSSLVYNNDLALIAAKLSDAAEDKDGSRIRELYSRLGYKGDVFLGNYKASLAYSIADKEIEVDGKTMYLLTLTARGSKTASEYWKDFSTGATKDFLGYKAYDVVYDFEEEIWKGLNQYLEEHAYLYDGNLKVFITGHSLGGAAANLTAARFTHFTDGGAWWSGILGQEDIYAYTFGAIDSIKSGASIGENFENIHNIYNFYDSFGPSEYGAMLPSGVGTVYAKFGHIDMFAKQYREDGYLKFDTANHNMPGYIDALENGYVVCRQGGVRIIISCPVQVVVLYHGQVVGLIQDNEVVREASEVPMTVIGESKYILFGETEGYSIFIKAAKKGEMSYSVENLSEGTAAVFENIALTEGKTIRSRVTNSPDETRLYVVGNDGKDKKEIAVDGTERYVSFPVPGVFVFGACLLLLFLLRAVLKRKKRYSRDV